MPERRDGFAMLGVFLGALAMFLASPVRQVADSNLTVLLSQSLLERRSFALEPYFWHGGGVPGQTDPVDGHLYYFYPAGSSVLSLPLVAVLRVFGLSAVTPEGGFDPRGEARMQAILAPLLMAGLCVVLLRTARLLLPLGQSLLVTGATAFGSPIWSTASRALWSHTWEILLLGLAILELVSDAVGRRRLRPVRLGALLVLAYAVRPTAIVSAGAITLYVLVERRGAFWRLAWTGAVGFGLFVLAALALYGTWLPTYYRTIQPPRGESFFWRLLGVLVSPSRGLLVLVPGVLAVAWLLVRQGIGRGARGWGPGEARALLTTALGASAGSILLTAAWPVWWGGHCYGPRLLTDLVPWLFLLAVLALRHRASSGARLEPPHPLPPRPSVHFASPQAGEGGSRLRSALPLYRLRAREAHRRSRRVGGEGALRAEAAQGIQSMPAWKRRVELMACLLLALAGVLINGAGALSPSTWLWNARPVGIDQDTARLWDWSRAQFLAVFEGFFLQEVSCRPSGLEDAPALPPGGRLLFGPEAKSLGFLGAGWGQAEGAFHWSSALRAELCFSLSPAESGLGAARLPSPESGSGAARLRLRPYLAQGRLPRQRLRLLLNGRKLADWSLDQPLPRELACPIPSGVLRPHNRLELELPDAASPASLGAGADERELGVAVWWLEVI